MLQLSIQESQHPGGELGAIGHIPVVSEDVGVFYSSYLREVLAAAANLESVAPKQHFCLIHVAYKQHFLENVVKKRQLLCPPILHSWAT